MSHALLVTVIAIGVGFFVAAAIVRIILNIPIAYLLAAGYVLIITLSFFTPIQFVPVAFDADGVTTGPVTVPVILALGIAIEPEKEVVLTLVSRDMQDTVMAEIEKAGELDKPGAGLSFVLPVEKLIGVIHLGDNASS